MKRTASQLETRITHSFKEFDNQFGNDTWQKLDDVKDDDHIKKEFIDAISTTQVKLNLLNNEREGIADYLKNLGASRSIFCATVAVPAQKVAEHYAKLLDICVWYMKTSLASLDDFLLTQNQQASNRVSLQKQTSPTEEYVPTFSEVEAPRDLVDEIFVERTKIFR